MAMKVNKTTIHRLSVDMSCGCNVYAEFKDAQCKEPLPLSCWVHLGSPEPSEGNPYNSIFTPCEKHKGDAGLSMLDFLMRERLDEAVEEAQKAQVHSYAPPSDVIEEGDTGGVIATGDNVQSVKRIVKPVAVRPRPQNSPSVKTVQRSVDQLAKAGALVHAQSGGASDMQEVAEDPRYTPHIAEALDFLDERERGIIDDNNDEA